MKSLRRTEYIDPGGPGGGGGMEGFNDMSTHSTILNRNAENALRRNNHNWGTNIFFPKNPDKNSQRFKSSQALT